MSTTTKPRLEAAPTASLGELLTRKARAAKIIEASQAAIERLQVERAAVAVEALEDEKARKEGEALDRRIDAERAAVRNGEIALEELERRIGEEQARLEDERRAAEAARVEKLEAERQGRRDVIADYIGNIVAVMRADATETAPALEEPPAAAVRALVQEAVALLTEKGAALEDEVRPGAVREKLTELRGELVRARERQPELEREMRRLAGATGFGQSGGPEATRAVNHNKGEIEDLEKSIAHLESPHANKASVQSVTSYLTQRRSTRGGDSGAVPHIPRAEVARDQSIPDSQYNEWLGERQRGA